MPPALDDPLRRELNEGEKKKKKRIRPGVTVGGGRIAVDLWRTTDTSARHFFLTHCHTDHTHGLTPSWRHGPIYCSPVTARLLKVMFGLADTLLRPLEVNESHQLGDFCVTLLDANHCPGAVMFLFESDLFGTVLCTGDMRHDHRMEKLFATEPAFIRLQNLTIDHIYLDNTYLDEKIAEFPTREEAIAEIAEIIRNRPEMDVFIGMNKLGKEEMLVGVAKSLQEWIEVDANRKRTLEAIEAEDVFVTGSNEGEYVRIKTCQMQKVNAQLAAADKENTPAIGIVASMLPLLTPFQKNRRELFWVRYSDHSSSSELIAFLKRLTFKRLTPIAKEIAPERITELILLSAKTVADVDSDGDSARDAVRPSTSKSDTITSALQQKWTVLPVRTIPIRTRSTPTRRKRGRSPVQFDTPQSPTRKKRRENSCSPEPERASEKPSDVIERLLEVGRQRSTNGIRFDATDSVEEPTDQPDGASDSSAGSPANHILNISATNNTLEAADDANTIVLLDESPTPNAVETNETNVQPEADARETPAPPDFIIDVETVLLWERILFGSS